MVGVLDGALYGPEGVPDQALVTGQQPEQAEDVPAPLVHADLRQVRALKRVLGGKLSTERGATVIIPGLGHDGPFHPSHRQHPLLSVHYCLHLQGS